MAGFEVSPVEHLSQTFNNHTENNPSGTKENTPTGAVKRAVIESFFVLSLYYFPALISYRVKAAVCFECFDFLLSVVG